jgi:serine/threonine protein kinase
LKPANIFLNDQFQPVIGDFGLATDFNTRESVGPSMSIGTPLHMAPEIWMDESNGYHQAVDVYAYAVFLYTLFASDPSALLDDGKPRAKNVNDLMKRIGNGARFQRLPTIGNGFWELMTNAWHRAPDRRPTFSQIIDGMIANVPDFLFPGADETEVRQYVATMQRLR